MCSDLPWRKAILIFGYPSEEWPMEPGVDAFERLTAASVAISDYRIERIWLDNVRSSLYDL